MCYNCGCGITGDDMGKGKISKGGGSLTDDDWKQMADKWSMSVDQAKKNVKAILDKQLGK